MTVTLVFYEDPAKFRGAVLSEAKITIRSLAIPWGADKAFDAHGFLDDLFVPRPKSRLVANWWWGNCLGNRFRRRCRCNGEGEFLCLTGKGVVGNCESGGSRR